MSSESTADIIEVVRITFWANIDNFQFLNHQITEVIVISRTVITIEQEIQSVAQ